MCTSLDLKRKESVRVSCLLYERTTLFETARDGADCARRPSRTSLLPSLAYLPTKLEPVDRRGSAEESTFVVVLKLFSLFPRHSKDAGVSVKSLSSKIVVTVTPEVRPFFSFLFVSTTDRQTPEPFDLKV